MFQRRHDRARPVAPGLAARGGTRSELASCGAAAILVARHGHGSRQKEGGEKGGEPDTFFHGVSPLEH